MAERKKATETNVNAKEIKKPMPVGLPYFAAGATFFICSFIFSIYKFFNLLAVVALSVLVGFLLNNARRKQLAAMPEVTPTKERAEELSQKLDEGRDTLNGLHRKISDAEVAETVGSMALTLEKLADNLEKNPKDRAKIRKVAVHYVPMITDLVKNYVNLQEQGVDGANITGSMVSIKTGLEKVDESLKQYLDDMFEDDKMSIETDIEVLKQLMNKDAANVNKLDFDDILNAVNENEKVR